MSLHRSHRARSQSSPLSTQPKYAAQGATHRRTEEAILAATKDLITTAGISKISARSQVARATLYNHFRDKSSVIEALLQAEIGRLIQQMQNVGTPSDALEFLSLSVSSDPALEGLRSHDPALLAQLLIHSEHPLYLDLARAIFSVTQSPEATGLAMRWLIGQAMQPVTPEQSRDQASLLVENTLF